MGIAPQFLSEDTMFFLWLQAIYGTNGLTLYSLLLKLLLLLLLFEISHLRLLFHTVLHSWVLGS